jgi:hypothetical protein
MTTQTNCPDCGVAVGQQHANKCEDAERLSPLAVYVGKDDCPTKRMTLRELSDYLRSLPQSVMDVPGTLIVHCSDGDISPVLATSKAEAELDEGECDSFWGEDDEFGAELHRIARECIQSNWHRTDGKDGGWHYFSTEELAAINERTGNEFDYGYCFLDEDGGTEGLIRLWVGQANPKWMFWKEGDSMKIELA